MNPLNDPEISDEEARRLLAPLQATPPRDPVAARQGREAFLLAASQIPAPTPRPPARRFWGLLLNKERSMIPVLTSVFVVLILAFGGATATAYAAQDSLPGEALYPVKTLTEDLTLSLANTPEEKLDKLIAFTDRRAAEAAALAESGQEIPPAFTALLEENLEGALELVAGMAAEPQQAAITRLQNALQVQERLLARQQDSPSPVLAEVRQMVIERLQVLAAGQKNPNAIEQHLRNQDKTNQPEDPGAPNASPGPNHIPGTPQGQKPENGPGPKHVPGTPQGQPDKPAGPEPTPGTPQGQPEDDPGPQSTPGAPQSQNPAGAQGPAHIPGTPQGPKPGKGQDEGGPAHTPGAPQGNGAGGQGVPPTSSETPVITIPTEGDETP